ncbi:hypothetical protein D934_12955 [Xylella fastidiosa subsp. sandyi Ann-1]|uniref:Uncharacterized protein n=1 Tax=Xylella fastidiosa subsp. sandyi Ann-1 TaxID=155920 RepID=A0A060H8K9_XYLFS|nr:hypothetical protein D934_12955 [Xylella fastidiosa subsp. sandyi Ann-1]
MRIDTLSNCTTHDRNKIKTIHKKPITAAPNARPQLLKEQKTV